MSYLKDVYAEMMLDCGRGEQKTRTVPQLSFFMDTAGRWLETHYPEIRYTFRSRPSESGFAKMRVKLRTEDFSYTTVVTVSTD